MAKIKNFFFLSLIIIAGVPCFSCQTKSVNDKTVNQGLMGYWKLSENILDSSENNLATIEHHVNGEMDIESANGFEGGKSWLEVLATPELKLGETDFSIAVWVNALDAGSDITGDVVSKYDAATRKGFHVSIKTNPSPTGVANSRQLSFGIDDNIVTGWEDRGRPGNALLAYSLTEYKGALYAGTCEPGPGDAGHVYRYDAVNQEWIDLGSPDQSNTVIALTEYKGNLYAGTGKYRVAGSSLPESENVTLGGRIFQFDGPDKWIDRGRLPDVEAIGSLVVYKGELYASSLYSPGFFKYTGNNQWEDLGTPDGKRLVSFGVFNGYLFATSYDVGNVYRYDGNDWVDCGQVGDNTQTYGFAVYQGQLYVSTWPSGRVFVHGGVNNWRDAGRLGGELEVMGLMVHNGQLMGGTLPSAETYLFEGDTTWRRMAQLDKTEDVRYRRAWTMAEHDGKVYCSTLPSGHVFSYEAGKSVAWDTPFPPGWHHVAAVKSTNRLKLFVDGELVNETRIPDSLKLDIESAAPLRIGFGQHDIFNGQVREARLYNRALKEKEIELLAKNSINW